MRLQAAGIKKPNPLNPAHAWALKGALLPYMKWRAGEMFTPRQRLHIEGPPIPAALAAHADYAVAGLEAQPRRDQQPDVQAPASPGRPAVPHGRAFAADPGPRRDALDQPLGRPAVEARSCTPRPKCSAAT